MSSTESSAGSYRIRVLERAYLIIDEVTAGPRTVPELAEKLDIDPATVYRIVRNLSHEGYLRQLDDSYRYGLGFKFLQLGHRLLEEMDLREIARPYLEELSERTGESSFLSLRDRYEVIFVDRVDGMQGIRLSVRVGDRRPLNAGAAGKLLLAYAPKNIIEAVVGDYATKVTDRTIVEEKALRAEIRRIHDAGYAESRGENTPGAGSFAAPIWDARGIVVAGLVLGGPQDRLLNEHHDRNLRAVLEIGAAISKELGATTESYPKAAVDIQP